MSKPSVSIVIPNLDSPVIDRTLESVRNQTYSAARYEVIVVGRDRPGLVREDERVRFLRLEDPGLPGENRNRGVEIARGEILVFLDADCLAPPDWLATLVARYADPDVNVVGGAVDFPHDRYWTLADNVSSFHEYMVDSPGEVRSILPSLNLSLRRQVFYDVGGFAEGRPTGEDTDLCLRLRHLGYRLYFERRAVIYHHPPRTTLKDLLRHAYHFGKYSVKVDPRYAGTPDALPALLRWRPSLVVAAPVLAAAVVARVFRRPTRWKLLHTAPAVFLAKVAWCIGAAMRPGDKDARFAQDEQRYLRKE